MFPQAYFPPTYFPPTYFPSGSPPSAVAFRDRHMLKLIAAALVATGEFDDVRTSGPPEERGTPSEESRLATLELKGWREEDQSNDYAAVIQDRTITFTLVIAVRHEDPDLRDDEADRLCQVCANAINGRSFGGVNIPDHTRLLSGVYHPAQSPERRLTCQGRLVYSVSDFGTHAANPD